MCPLCKGTDVEKKFWIDPNTGRIADEDEVGDYTEWCNDCNQHVHLKYKEKKNE